MRRGAALSLIGLLGGLIAVSTPAGSPAADFSVQRASVEPTRGFTAARAGVRIEFRIAAPAPAGVVIRIVGDGREVRRYDLGGVQPGTDQTQVWDGLNGRGVPVPDGSYRALIGDGAGADREAGSVALRGHFFPVRGPHGGRGAVGEFGAGRNGGRTHIGFDITGRCGTPLAAVRTGTVVKRAFDPRLDGNFIVIRGLGERRKYQYSHMVRPSPLRRGDTVHIGEIVGQIGRTGNAGSTPCHLHFELYRRGRPIDPKPALRAWDRYS
ncbi:MAG: peptidoglycan DD-metalloendopeptidase family protein [Solirubrobacterales bacterium]